MTPLSLCLLCGQWSREDACQHVECKMVARHLRLRYAEKLGIATQALILSRMAAA